MSRFISVNADNPSDVKHINLDCVMASADYGDDLKTKLYMSSGKEMIIKMPYSEFKKLLRLDSSES